MPRSKSGHKSRSVMKSNKKKSRKSIKRSYKPKPTRTPSKLQIKNEQKDLELSKKIFYNMILEKSQNRGPTKEDTKRLLILRNKEIKKGNYPKAALYDAMASAYYFSFNPVAPPSIDLGRLGEPRTGIHAPADPNTMVKYGTLPSIKQPKTLSRKEKRRATRKGYIRGGKRSQKIRRKTHKYRKY